MADPLPPAQEPKKETVRISLPPRSGAEGSGDIKRETVRITLPPKPGMGGSSVPSVTTPLPPRPAAPATARMPAPQSGGGTPLPPPRAGTPPLVKPAAATAAPGATVPGGVPRPAASGVAPVVSKPTSPKKETARIQLPPEPKSMPKATVKLEQTQPLAHAQRAQVSAASSYETTPAKDTMSTILSFVAFLASAGAAVLAYLGGQ